MTRIKGINRKNRKPPQHKMQIDGRSIFTLEEIKKKKRDKIIKKKRKEKEKAQE